MAKAQTNDRVDPFHRAGLVESQPAALLIAQQRNIDDPRDIERKRVKDIPIAKAGISVECGERMNLRRFAANARLHKPPMLR